LSNAECIGYVEAGYACVGDYCAAAAPGPFGKGGGGSNTFCAQHAPDYHVLSASTGRCVPPSNTPAGDVCLTLEVEGCVGIYAGNKMNGVYAPFHGDCGNTNTTMSAAYYSVDTDNFLYVRNETSSLWEVSKRCGSGTTRATGYAGETYPFVDTADTWHCALGANGVAKPMSITCTAYEEAEVRAASGKKLSQQALSGC